MNHGEIRNIFDIFNIHLFCFWIEIERNEDHWQKLYIKKTIQREDKRVAWKILVKEKTYCYCLVLCLKVSGSILNIIKNCCPLLSAGTTLFVQTELRARWGKQSKNTKQSLWEKMHICGNTLNIRND